MSSATSSVFWVIGRSLVSLYSRPLWERHSRAGAPSGGEKSLCAIVGHLQGPSGPARLQHPWPDLKTPASSCHPQLLSTHTMVSVSFNASCNMVYQSLPYFIQKKKNHNYLECYLHSYSPFISSVALNLCVLGAPTEFPRRSLLAFPNSTVGEETYFLYSLRFCAGCL